ncbi:LamG domain-containing protein [Agromyces albus]|nr:LamG domain-containing protein [Agromyces albus]
MNTSSNTHSRRPSPLIMIALVGSMGFLSGCGSISPTPSTGTDEWVLLGPGSDSTISVEGGAELMDGTLSLDGQTGFAKTSAPEGFRTTESFTASAWVSVAADFGPFATAISQIGDVAGSFYLGLADGAFAFSMKDADTNDDGHTYRAVGAPAGASQDRWVHLAGVYDAQASTMTLYVDGEEEASEAFGDPIQVDGDVVIGGAQSHGNASDFWGGAVTAVELRPTAMTADEIGAIVDDTRPEGAPPTRPVDASTYGEGVLDGTWDSAFTPDELALIQEDLETESGMSPLTSTRLGFSGPRWWLGFMFGDELWLLNGVPEGDGGVFTIDGDVLTTDNGHDVLTYTWSLDGNRLALTLVGCDGRPCDDMERLMTERTFTRSGTDATY